MEQENKQFRQLLRLAYTDFRQMSEDNKTAALDLTMQLLRKMLQDGRVQRQKLAELETTKRKQSPTRSHVEKARGKLVRKTNAASPQPPVKPVKVTKKNEQRR